MCQSVAKGLPRENPITWPVSKKPWRRVHADFAGPINGVTYLVLVDPSSKWPEVIKIASTSASDTISVLDKILAAHCLPETIVTDNCDDTIQFCSVYRTLKNHATEHIRSPPYHPQSNGQVEKFVNTLKRALLYTKRWGRIGRINEKIPYLIENKRPPRAQWKVTCRSIDGKNCLNN